ncbi:peptidylprolyl isomerase [bacterium]|nr:peptidylprolyl isomerase [bacterium]
MMTQLRSQMKAILWVLVIAFLATIVFSWGMGGFKNPDKPGIIGEINGKEISLENFDNIIRFEHENAVRQANGEELDDDALKEMREKAWDNEVERILKMKDSERLDIKITDAEIAHIVEEYPPNEIREIENFQTDGKFDIELYKNFLRDPQALQYLLQIEQRVKGFLYDQEINFYVSNSTDVSIEEIKDEYLKGAANGKLRFLVVLENDFDVDSSEITEEMMRKYYHLFSDKFTKYAQRKFAYVKFRTVPTEEDNADVMAEAKDLFKDIQNGADFEKLAERYSEDKASASKGGDLDWFDREAMVPEFSDAAFAAKPGDLVGPVESKYGLHIIKVEDKRVEDGTEEVKARHILLKYKASPETREQTYSDAYNFSQDILEKGFDQVVEQYDYQIDTTDYFSEAGYIKGLGRMRMAAQFCFGNPVGAKSGVYPIPDGYIVFKIVEAVDESVKPFAEAKESIFRSLEKIALKNKVWKKAADLAARIESVEDMSKVAAAESMVLHVTEDSMKVTGKLPDGLKSDRDFLTKAFRLEEGQLSDVIQTKNGCYIAYMERKSSWNQEEYLVHHSLIYQDKIKKQQEQAARNWIRELRVAADIKDYRYKYFRDF